jgi:hypothetical protein
MKELNVADNQLALKADAQTMSDVDISGVAALANVISGMGALSKLDVRDNHIPPTEEALLQGACGIKGVSLCF